MFWHHFFLVMCDIILNFWLLWGVSWSGKRHDPFIGSQYPSMIFSFFFLLWICVSQKLLYIHCHKIVQFRLYWSVGWGRFLHVLSGLINCELEFGLGDWIPLWINWLVSHWLDFLMAPWCWLWLPGQPDSVVFKLSQIFNHLHLVLVFIKY